MNRFYHIAYIVVKPILSLLFPHRVVGLENLPEGGALLCANHASGWDPVLIAICLPNEDIGREVPPQLPLKDQLILVYCRSGNRSKQASDKLAALGYTNVVEFGGINTWPGDIIQD